MISEVTLTEDDEKRISKCKEYVRHRNILNTKEYNKEFEVGSAVSIKRRDSDKYLVGTSLYNPKNKQPTKFLIIKNDDGFVFAKRVTASGKPGKEILCLTTDYPIDRWELVADDAMLDALLLDQDYDPLADAKALQSRKGKASRRNAKHKFVFDSPKEALTALQNMQVGTSLWSSYTTFGEGRTEWTVVNIETKKVNTSNIGRSYGRAVTVNRHHSDCGFDYVVKMQLKMKSTDARYVPSEKDVYFYNVCNTRNYKPWNTTLYTRKPVKAEDMI